MGDFFLLIPIKRNLDLSCPCATQLTHQPLSQMGYTGITLSQGNLPKPPLAFLMVSAKQLKPPLTYNSSVPSSLFLQKPVKHSGPHTRHYLSCKHKMQQLKQKFCRGGYHSLCLLLTRLKDVHFAIAEVFKQQEIKGVCTCFFAVVDIAQLYTLLKSQLYVGNTKFSADVMKKQRACTEITVPLLQ